MAIAKRTLIAGAAIAAVSIATVGGVGLASAATANSNEAASSSIIDKLVTKFDLNKDEVKAVFAEDHAEHRQQMKDDMAQQLAQAVTDGKLTQEQADHITQAKAEIESLIGDATAGEQDEAVREQIKTKMEALRTWAKDNNIDMRLIGPGGHGGPGREMMQRPFDGNAVPDNSNQ